MKLKKIVFTGDRPSGELHLGHYIGTLQNRVKLQNIYKQFIMLADIQALTDNVNSYRNIIQNMYEIVKDYIGVGIDPKKTTIFIQSQVPEIFELTIYYLNFITLNRVMRNPTLKTEIQQKKFTTIPMGFICYPIIQAADITLFRAQITPVGKDQIPIIEQVNEIIRKFNNFYKTNYLKECKPYLSGVPKLIGIEGKAKASKTLNNTIFLADTPKTIKEKVFNMFTDPKHLSSRDPGKIEGNVVFTYLDVFYPDKDELYTLKSNYKKGGLGDTVIKTVLNDTLQKLLKPIREERKLIKKKDIKKILINGSCEAREVAKSTIDEIRKIMNFKSIY